MYLHLPGSRETHRETYRERPAQKPEIETVRNAKRLGDCEKFQLLCANINSEKIAPEKRIHKPKKFLRESFVAPCSLFFKEAF